ncbi:hypothetical protein SBF1_770002 [Candidatus Desulfosporosinus infrequens]|uniref:Uncharacterized protein n=1 Tax=Candidatus Desulfosporosinus infrequens TaxID=2043169 RepID=A0A2U3LRJ4_9FIRM|nr:hypothetical protein SBF1_770002 [Candidatus Desulfosporosinus infrequens]
MFSNYKPLFKVALFITISTWPVTYNDDTGKESIAQEGNVEPEYC